MASSLDIGVEVLQLGSVVLPEFHPRAAAGRCPIQAFVIGHPDGLILVDTGVGVGNELIDELYRPTTMPLVDALTDVGVDERDIAAVVHTHLHFDHCGQNDAIGSVPTWVQAAELDAASEPGYTVPEWAAIAVRDLRVADGDVEIAPGVTLLATPGHTPGHQSVLIETAAGPGVIVGQCCYSCHEFERDTVDPGDLHDESWADAADTSLARLRSLDPTAAWFSHDPVIYRGGGKAA